MTGHSGRGAHPDPRQDTSPRRDARHPRRAAASGPRRARGTDEGTRGGRELRPGGAPLARPITIACVVLALTVPVAMAVRAATPQDQATVAIPDAVVEPTPTPSVTPTVEVEEDEGPEPTPEQRQDPKKKAEPPRIPERGPGTWQTSKFAAESDRRDGRTVRVRVRVEKTLPIKADDAAKEAAEILHDDRSWQRSENLRFDFVGSGESADLTINIATPATTDKNCLPARTGGELSCRNGNEVNLNAKRWLLGARAYGDDMENYRRYLVNHEVGHFLGHGHEGCPAAGERAPLMMQQTKGVGKCKPYPWPN